MYYRPGAHCMVAAVAIPLSPPARAYTTLLQGFEKKSYMVVSRFDSRPVMQPAAGLRVQLRVQEL
jgi:hypothetical protein